MKTFGAFNCLLIGSLLSLVYRVEKANSLASKPSRTNSLRKITQIGGASVLNAKHGLSKEKFLRKELKRRIRQTLTLDFTQESYSGNLPENEQEEFEILQVSMTSDITSVSYRLIGADESIFAIDSDGRVIAKQPVDREGNQGFTFEVEASSSGNTQTAEIRITVIDENDNGPKFSRSLLRCLGSCSIMENDDSDQVVTITDVPTDPDDTILGHSTPFSYQIVENELDGAQASSVFDIGVNPSGQIILTANSKVDREEKDYYEFNIQALDNQNFGESDEDSKARVLITIDDVNDNKPYFEYNDGKLFANVNENLEVGDTVLEVTANDPDDAATFQLEFSLLSASPKFAIRTKQDNPVGEIYLLEKVDYENEDQREYTFTVEVSDPDLDESQLQNPDISDSLLFLNVDIFIEDANDNSPQFQSSSYTADISEDDGIGTTIGTISAQDLDATSPNNLFTYQISSSDPSAQFFDINKDSGVITTINELDRETNASFNIAILAVDQGDPANTNSVTFQVIIIDINDNPPLVSLTDLEIKEGLGEGARASPEIRPVDADLPENGAPFIYEITGPAGIEDTFDIVLEEGDGSIAYIEAKVNLFRSIEDKYQMFVKISDSGTLSSEVTFNIEVVSGVEAVKGTLSFEGLIAIIAALVLLLLIVLLVAACKYKGSRKKALPVYVDDELRENIIAYDEEGGGEEDEDNYDINLLRKEIPEGSDHWKERKPEDEDHIQPASIVPVQSGALPLQTDVPPTNIRDFLDKGISDADEDPTMGAPDSLMIFDYEGEGSTNGSLSSLNSGSTDGSQDYGYLNDWGRPFQRLADMYTGGESD